MVPTIEQPALTTAVKIVGCLLESEPAATDIALVKEIIHDLELTGTWSAYEELQLRCIQKKSNFVHPNATRWGSTLAMLERFDELWPATRAILDDSHFSELLPNPKPQWFVYLQSHFVQFKTRLTSLIQALKPCDVTTKALQKSSLDLLPSAIPLVKLLFTTLEEFKSHYSIKLLAELHEYLDFLFDTVTCPLLASALCPKYADLSFVDSPLATDVWKALEKCLIALAPNASSGDSDDDDEDSVTMMLEKLRRRLLKKPEMTLLEFWNEPKPKKCVQACVPLARMIFSAPVTSADSERVFSHAGFQLRKHRHNLSETHVEQIIVLLNTIPDQTDAAEKLINAYLLGSD
jgi:hypothetical protein